MSSILLHIQAGFYVKKGGCQKSMAGEVARKEMGSAGIIFSIPDCDYNQEIFPIFFGLRGSPARLHRVSMAQDRSFVAMSGRRQCLCNLPAS